jgi:glycerol-3-phosphate dehydrogenase
MPELGERAIRAFESDRWIGADPAYRHIVCFCERVTEGEVRDALSSVVPATDVGGVGRRTRATNGRCQGFFCGADIAARLAARLAAVRR